MLVVVRVLVRVLVGVLVRMLMAGHRLFVEPAEK